MKYIYGPIQSRRLGLSLGISLTRFKICSFDCVYCQWGKTTQKTCKREEYLAADKIISELKTWLQDNKPAAEKLDYVTLSGFGEPTLNIKLAELIEEIKKIISLPIAVLTNSSFLGEPAVRKSLLRADLIIPSLDAVEQETFEKIDQPEPSIKIEGIIDGLIALSREFPGRIWVEIMLVRGINDSIGHLVKLQQVIDRINPDKIQLNSPVRKTKEQNISALDRNELEMIKRIFGSRCEIL